MANLLFFQSASFVFLSAPLLKLLIFEQSSSISSDQKGLEIILKLYKNFS